MAVGSTAPATAASGPRIVEYRIPTPSANPNRITTGPDGNLWFTELGTFVAPGAPKIGRMTPNGHFRQFAIPAGHSRAFDITTGPDGALWFTQTGEIGRITVQGHITEYPVVGGGALKGITSGPDHTLYFVADGAIGRISTRTKAVRLFPALAGTSPEEGLTIGPDGNIWFTAVNALCPGGSGTCSSHYAGAIERMTLNGVVNGYFATPTPYSVPSRIVVGPDGNLWFTEQGNDPEQQSPGAIGRITPQGVITEFNTPTPGSDPHGITVGSDWNLWFTEDKEQISDSQEVGADNIGRITTSGEITEFPFRPLPENVAEGRADGITTGPNGDIYFTDHGANAIGRVFV